MLLAPFLAGGPATAALLRACVLLRFASWQREGGPPRPRVAALHDEPHHEQRAPADHDRRALRVLSRVAFDVALHLPRVFDHLQQAEVALREVGNGERGLGRESQPRITFPKR